MMPNRYGGLCLLAVTAAGLALAQEKPPPPVWTALNAGAVRQHSGAIVSGRVNAAIVDPTCPTVAYLATDGGRPTGALGNPATPPVVGLPDTGGGGVWKTSNWGSGDATMWTALTDNLPSPSIAVNGLAMAPSNSSILYAAADGPQGCILKTTDGGQHWAVLGGETFAAIKFGSVAVSPSDPNTVYAGVFQPAGKTQGGVWKSTDGGANWKLVTGQIGACSHVVICPTDPNLLYAAIVSPAPAPSQGVWMSSNGGATWQNLSGNFQGHTVAGIYGELAIAPSNVQSIYLVVMTLTGQGGTAKPVFYRTTNGGALWEPICPTNADPDNRFWHQVLGVYPLNPQLVFAEGFNHQAVYTTTGGAASSPWGACPGSCDDVWTIFWTTDDPAGVSFYPTTSMQNPLAMAAFGDRGIYQAADPVNAPQDLSHQHGNLSNTLIQTVAVNPSDPSNVYAIAFDQGGTLVASSATAPYWDYVNNGGKLVGYEFGKVVFDPTAPTTLYNFTSTAVNEPPSVVNIVQFSTDGGSSWKPMTTGLNSADFFASRGLQTNPATWKAFEIDSSNPDRLLLGAKQVFQWLNGSGMGTNLWKPISPALVSPADGAAFISSLAIAPSQPQTVYAATSVGQLWRTTNGGTTWLPLATLSLPAGGFIARIEVNPANASAVAVAVQGPTGRGRVYITLNGGGKWSDLTANLPTGLVAYTLAVDWRPRSPRLYAGTDRGVFVASLPTPNWQRFATGLPNTLVDDLRVVYPSAVMTAATYGRGAFQVTLPPP